MTLPIVYTVYSTGPAVSIMLCNLTLVYAVGGDQLGKAYKLALLKQSSLYSRNERKRSRVNAVPLS